MKIVLTVVTFYRFSLCFCELARKEILNHLLNSSKYDARIAPNYEEDRATNVTLQLHIMSINSINEMAMDLSMEVFLRQTWVDPRLNFERLSNFSNLELDQRMMGSVWIPDTYFPNEKEGHFHVITVPNRLLHISRNGTVFYSIRLSLTLTCRMNLYNYPMDEQNCPVFIETYGYTEENVLFNWKPVNAVIVDEVEMPQFHFREEPSIKKCTRTFKYSSVASFTCLTTTLHLQRNIGYYMAQVFIPSILIVILSWVSFWVHVDAIPARISLGVLTVLTITTQSSGIRATLPRVSYVKAIDVWNSMCLLFVFAALLEYAYINVQTRRHQKSMLKDTLMNVQASHPLMNSKGEAPVRCIDVRKTIGVREIDYLKTARTVDKVSRVAFPIAFIIFNTVFWTYYMYASDHLSE
ncbi:glycine receptor subunit alpha-1-like isoform X1 [Saccostrea echinata]|uniref:glycine receptor subunit alpha-1-like isoform X1 n=2 Tax=Saccostrea echinata TaxID=191078 RepID=UPI002A822662|nr:glycine receptor subunit alpha-1-like isoform X1 [Saccostrea echinata]